MQLQKGNEYEVSKSQQLILASGLVGTGFMKENRSGLEVNQTFLYYHILRGNLQAFSILSASPSSGNIATKGRLYICYVQLYRYPIVLSKIPPLPPKN